jgi:hypothetical protein
MADKPSSGWGGARPGAGRKPDKEAARQRRPQMRATDDEWALIKEFERVVKKGGPAAIEAARDFLARWRA